MSKLNFIKDIAPEGATHVHITPTYLMSEYGSNLIWHPDKNDWTELKSYDHLLIENLYRLDDIS